MSNGRNEINQECKFLCGDWCHNPKRMPQEKCCYYLFNKKCFDFKEKEVKKE